uniref:Uncharacterized protein n=1 Tax=Malurus cyaneus samueli TaxID=2593467 RepID=A0A8C5TYF2_9PASS
MPDGGGMKIHMPKVKVPSVVDVSLKEPQVTVPSAAAEVDVSLPAAEIQVPGVEVTVETGAVAAEGEKGRFKMPDVKMPSVKLPKVKGPHAQVSLPKADISLPKGQEGEVALQGPEAEASLDVAAGKAEGGGMKIHMPKVKVPSVVFSKPTVKAPKLDVDVSLPQAELKAGDADVTIAAPDIKLPSVEGSLELQAPDVDLKAPTVEGKLEMEGTGLKGKLKMPKFDKPKFALSSPKVEAPSAEVSLPSPTVKAPKLDVDVSLPQAELQAGDADVTIAAPDIKLPSVEGSLELQAPDVDLKAPTVEGKLEMEGTGLKGKLKMPKFDKPKFALSSPKVEAPSAEVSLPSAEVELPSATVTASGEGPTLGLKADIPGAKTEGAGWKLEKPSLKMPKADIKAPKAGISLPSVDVTLPQANVDLQAPEAALSLEGEVKGPEKEAAKTKDGKFKMPKFGMPSFGWSSSREAKGTVASEVDVSLKEPQVTVPSAAAEVDVSLPAAEIQVPGVEVTVETGAVAAEGEKGRFKMPDVKMPSVKLPKVKGPHAQVSLPKADISLPKGQEGEVALQGPEAEASLDVAAGKAEGGGMKIHMPKVKVPSVVFSKPTVKAPKLDVDVSLPQAELKAGDADVTIAAPDIKLPSVEGSLELQAPDVDLKAPTVEGKLEMEGTGLKGKLKMPKFDKPKFALSSPKVEAPSAEVSLPSAEVELPSATVTASGEGPTLGLKADIPGAKTEGAGWKLEKPSLKMPKADIKAPKVDISLPSVDVTLPQASVDLQAPEAALGLEGEVKGPEKEAAKTKDGKFKMPKFGMPSFGWSSSREAKGTVASEVDVSLKEPQVTVPSVEVPTLDVSLDSSCAKEGEMVKSRTSVFKMPKISLSKSFTPHEQIQSGVEVSVSETICYSLTEETPSVPSESVGTKPLPDIKGDSISKSSKFRIPSIGFSKAEALDGQTTSVKIPKFRKPKFRIRSKGKASESDVGSSEESEIARGRITSDVTDPDIGKPAQISDAQLGVKLLKPSSEVALGAPTLDPNLAPVDVTLPKLEAEIHGPDLECKTEQEVVSGEKGTEEKENKFKQSKFKLPSFRWSPKKEAIAPSHIEGHLEGPALSGDMESELTFSTPENQHLQVEFDSTEKDGEKVKTKKSQFTMPKISFPKIKGQKVQVSLPILETDVSGPKQEKEGVSEQKSEQATSGAGARLDIKVPEVTVPTLEFSKPEAKAPKIEMDVPTGEAILLTCEEG